MFEKTKPILYALILSVLTMFAWLWWNERGLSIGNEELYMKWQSALGLFTGKDFGRLPDDFLFINTSNDLQLVDVYEDADGIPLPVGNTSITDREKLTKLFELLSHADGHKYIFLDILLEKRHVTPSDSVLSAAINSTPRMVYAQYDRPLLDGLSPDKAGMVSYTTTMLNGDFCKYELMTHGRPSMAYKAYRELFPGDRLCPDSFIPVLYFNEKARHKRDSYCTQSKILNLGVDVLNPFADFNKLIKDKYVFIGNFGDYDVHSTYLDRMDGIQIHANAFANLLRQKHTYHPLVLGTIILTLFCFYFLLLSRNNPGSDSAPYMVKLRNLCSNGLVRFLLSFLTIGAVFIFLFYFLLLTTGRIVEVTSLSLLFIFLWNLPGNKYYKSVKRNIPKVMNKLKKSKGAVSALILIVFIAISLPARCESFRILYISHPAKVYCDNELKVAGDTVWSGTKIRWTNPSQAMRVQSLTDGSYKIFRNVSAAKTANMELKDYLKSTLPMAGRGDKAQTVTALRAAIPDTLYLLDRIEIPSDIVQTPSNFFFIEYDMDGEVIRKKLPFTEGKVTIDRDIYVIDGKTIPPFTVPINILYNDETTNYINIIGENKFIVPLGL